MLVVLWADEALSAVFVVEEFPHFSMKGKRKDSKCQHLQEKL